MNSRKRVKKAILYMKPDRVPIDLGGPQSTIEIGAYKKLLELLEIKSNPLVFLRAHVIPNEEILDRLEVDTRYIYYKKPIKWDSFKPENNIYYDEWGLKWLVKKELYCHELIESPLSKFNGEKEEIEKYPWPINTDVTDINRWKEKIKYLYEQTDYYIIGDSIGWGIFEQSWGLRGIENFYMDLIRNPGSVVIIMDKVLEVQKHRLESYLKVVGPYIGAICMSDDVSGQDGPLISPDMYREFIKPRHKDLIKFIKNWTDAKVFFHCCGDILPFIEDFIEIGVDILNPIQVSAREMNDTLRLKKDYGKRIVFWGGGCDSQKILPYGDMEDIKNEVQKRMAELDGDGGFIFAPIHNIQNDVPPQNILALYNSAINYNRRRYKK